MRKLTYPALMLVAFCAFGRAAVADDFVVAASSATSVSPGVLLNSESALTLGAGESVTLIGPAGPVDIAGPFEGVVAAAVGASGGGQSALADLVSRRKRLRAVGASRGAGDAATETVFQLLADNAYCVGGQPPKLFLAPAKADRIVILTGSNGGIAEMLWPANASTVDWPADAAFEAGVSYVVTIGDIEMPGGFALKAAASGATETDTLNALIASGCLAQAEAALAALSDKG
jgi:hypothetical protein